MLFRSQPLYMERSGFSEADISSFIAFRFLGVVLLAIPLGLLIPGKRVRPLFYLSSLLVPVFGLLIVYAIHVKNISLIFFFSVVMGSVIYIYSNTDNTLYNAKRKAGKSYCRNCTILFNLVLCRNCQRNDCLFP